MFRSVDGVKHSVNFDLEAAIQSIDGDRGYDATRFFTEDSELLHFAGRTYALTNQWGKNSAPTLDALVTHFSDRGLSYREAAD